MEFLIKAIFLKGSIDLERLDAVAPQPRRITATMIDFENEMQK